MKQVKLIVVLLLLTSVAFSQTVTPDPGPYSPLNQKYEYRWIKTSGGIWNIGKFVVADSAQFLGQTYVPTAPDGDSSLRAANTEWIKINVAPGVPGQPTSAWVYRGNYSDADPTNGRLGFKDSMFLPFITNNQIRLVIPDNGINRSSAGINKYLTFDTVTKKMYYADGGSGGSSVTVTSYGKNASLDSTILLLSDGTRYAAKDSVGGGGGDNFANANLTAIENRLHEFSNKSLKFNSLDSVIFWGSEGLDSLAYDEEFMAFDEDPIGDSTLSEFTTSAYYGLVININLDVDGVIVTVPFNYISEHKGDYFYEGAYTPYTSYIDVINFTFNVLSPVNFIANVETSSYEEGKKIAFFEGDKLVRGEITIPAPNVYNGSNTVNVSGSTLTLNSGDISGNGVIYNEITGGFAIGYNLTNSDIGYNSFAGAYSTAKGLSSFAFGGNAKANGGYSFALGYSETNGLHSYAFGTNSRSDSKRGFAIGNGVVNKIIQSISIGEANDTSVVDNVEYLTRGDSKRLFEIGNGYYGTDENGFRSNAITVLWGGNVGIGNTTNTLLPNHKLVVDGNISIDSLGGKILITEGLNASLGVATLIGGTVTINTSAISTGSKIFVSVNTPSGTQGFLSAPSSSITDGVSFTINSTSATETSTVNWWIVN